MQIILKIFPRIVLIKLSILLQPLLSLVFKGSKFTDPINGKKYTLASQHLATNLLLLRHKAPQPPDRSAEHRIVGRRRGAAGARARAALGPVHRPRDESRRRWSLLDRVRAQQELHDRHGGALVGGGVVLGARGGVDAAPGHMRF